MVEASAGRLDGMCGVCSMHSEGAMVLKRGKVSIDPITGAAYHAAEFKLS